MQSIYLNNCKINDHAAILIFHSINDSANQKIKKIYLNQNLLTDKSGNFISQVLLEGSNKIKEIGISNNKLTATSGN